MRGRARVLLAYRRPDGLRLEVPGPSGAHLILVARGDALTAVFPGERAVFQGMATPESFEALTGLALTPAEVMDLLSGSAPGRVRDFEVRWRDGLPRRMDGRLPDDTRFSVRVESAETGVPLVDRAFEEPAHSGYRHVTAEEARGLGGRR